MSTERDLQEENRELRVQIEWLTKQVADLEARTKTTFSPAGFVFLLSFVPIAWAFVGLGGVFFWKVLSDPERVGPHVDILLVAFAIFSNPVAIALKDIVGMMRAERTSKGSVEANDA